MFREEILNYNGVNFQATFVVIFFVLTAINLFAGSMFWFLVMLFGMGHALYGFNRQCNRAEKDIT